MPAKCTEYITFEENEIHSRYGSDCLQPIEHDAYRFIILGFYSLGLNLKSVQPISVLASNKPYKQMNKSVWKNWRELSTGQLNE